MRTMLDEKMEGALPSEPMENGVSHRLIHPAPAGAVLLEEKSVFIDHNRPMMEGGAE